MDFMSDASSAERRLIDRAKNRKIPINGSMELLPLCNMNCDMCYVRLSREEMMRQGQLYTAEEYLKIGQEMVDAGTLFLLLTGGEPLLYPDFQKLYIGLRQMGLILTINTNGTLLDEQWADFFARYKPRRINITIYGSSDQTYERLCHFPGGYTHMMRAVELLKERDIDVKLSISAVKENFDEIPQMFEAGEKLDVPVHLDAYMMPVKRERSRAGAPDSRLTPDMAALAARNALKHVLSSDIYSQYVSQTLDRIENFTPLPDRKMSCLAGSCSYTINWQGMMRSCVVMDDPSESVFSLGFEEAWKRLRSKADRIEISETCRICRLKPVCRTCAAAGISETGRWDGVPEYLCRYSETYYQLLKEDSHDR